MNVEILKSKYPKSFEKLKEWSIKQIKSSGLSADILSSFPIDIAVSALFRTPQTRRTLYDFFDSYDVIMQCSYDAISKKFGFNVNRSTIVYSEKERTDAEETGFTICFSELEKLLS